MPEPRWFRRRLLTGGMALLAAPILAPARAEEARAIRLVIGWPPGGGVDAFGRILAPALAEALGRAVVVENIGGASGRLGSLTVARAAADGTTLLLANDSFAATEALPAPGGQPLAPALQPLALSAEAPNVLVVPAGSGLADIAAFAAAARARPGALNIGIPGIGSSQHLSSEILLRAAGSLRAEHVSYRGGGPLLADLAAGQVDAGVVTLGAAIPLLRDGRLRGLVVTTGTRNPAAPDIPTLGETLAPGFHLASWLGLFAPRGIPAGAIERLTQANAVALAAPEVASRLAALGFRPTPAPADAFGALVQATIDRYADIVASASLRAEGA